MLTNEEILKAFEDGGATSWEAYEDTALTPEQLRTDSCGECIDFSISSEFSKKNLEAFLTKYYVDNGSKLETMDAEMYNNTLYSNCGETQDEPVFVLLVRKKQD